MNDFMPFLNIGIKIYIPLLLLWCKDNAILKPYKLNIKNF